MTKLDALKRRINKKFPPCGNFTWIESYDPTVLNAYEGGGRCSFNTYTWDGYHHLRGYLHATSSRSPEFIVLKRKTDKSGEVLPHKAVVTHYMERII